MRRFGVLCVGLLVVACSGFEKAGDTTSSPPSRTTIPSPATTEPTSTSTTSITPTTLPGLVLGQPVLVTNTEGVFQIDSDGTVSQLVTGPVANAVDDIQGGLLFQTDRGGRDWDGSEVRSTVVWWIPAGASKPQPLLVPTPDSGDELLLHGAYSSDGSFGVVYERFEAHDPTISPHDWTHTLRRYERSDGTLIDLLRLPTYEHSYRFSVGPEAIAVTETDVAGSQFRYLDLAGNSVSLAYPVAWPDRPDDELIDCVLSDGRLAMLGFRLVAGESPFAVIRVMDSIAVQDLLVPVDGRWGPGGIDLSNDVLLLNRQWEGLFVEPALVLDINSPGAAPVELPIRGRARFVHSPIEIDGPVSSLGLTAGGPDHPATIVLAPDGLGAVRFGDPMDIAFAALVTRFGPPSEDTIAEGPFGTDFPYGYSATEYLRIASWDEPVHLIVTFSDSDFYFRTDGLVHFINWTYWGAELVTPEGVGVGATVDELRDEYGTDLHIDPHCLELGACDWGEWTFSITPPELAGRGARFVGLEGSFLTDPSDAHSQVDTWRAGPRHSP
ncbi:MAG: hypothetical protein OEO77_06975 [Acidimicrobiia bacterium]|nr:hypothetical protein [Acidimicrobiia bacterium]